MKAQLESAVCSTRKTRPLFPPDLATVVSIDAALAGRPRGAYFDRRLTAAQRDPERHLQLAVEENGLLAGFMLGRALEGEFGRSEPAVRLEAFGVAPTAQGHGLGTALAAAFEAEAARRGLREIRTAALWREHALLAFLDRAGYRLAPAHVLDCVLADAELGSSREAALEPLAPPADPNDYGTPRPSDFGSLARDRIEVGVLTERDMEGVARVALAARIDGSVAGFLMARVDYGDFGRTEPVAVIDTVGVDPLRARQGIGRALLSQLFMNLAGLGVERVETVVAAGNLELMGFFYRAGFGPSERLALVKRL
jgi:GNAT superfamily N-acetyltransferase